MKRDEDERRASQAPRQKTGSRRNRRPPIGDFTTEIARSRMATKARGPFMIACTACGELYWPDKREEHIAACRPPELHLNPTTKTARLYDFAKKHGITNMEVIIAAKQLGIADARVASSVLSSAAVARLEKHFIARKCSDSL